jgi:hypothetical protein
MCVNAFGAALDPFRIHVRWTEAQIHDVSFASYSGACLKPNNCGMARSRQLTTAQFLAFNNELETATFSLVEGLLALNSLSAANDFAHLPIQLIAQGLERLMKVASCLMHFEETGSLPPKKELKTHDLVLLTNRLLASKRVDAYRRARQAADEDITFLEKNDLFRRLLGVMSNFGEGGRYFDLDSALDPSTTQKSTSPATAFQQIEMGILQSHPEWEERLGTAEFRSFYPVLYADITEVIQRGIRALARFFSWDLLGELGKRLSGTMIATFLFMKDQDLRQPPGRWFE